MKVNTLWNFVREKENTEFIGITFLCRPLSKKIILSDELEKYEWLSFKEKQNLPKWLIKEISSYQQNIYIDTAI